MVLFPAQEFALNLLPFSDVPVSCRRIRRRFSEASNHKSVAQTCTPNSRRRKTDDIARPHPRSRTRMPGRRSRASASHSVSQGVGPAADPGEHLFGVVGRGAGEPVGDQPHVCGHVNSPSGRTTALRRESMMPRATPVKAPRCHSTPRQGAEPLPARATAATGTRTVRHGRVRPGTGELKAFC